jgi:lipopolysaccharide export system permease protein
MLILQRYLLRECFLASFMSLVVFLGVILALFLAELLAEAAQGQLPVSSIVILMLLRIPEAALLVGPLALMTGLLLVFGRLNEQSELVVLRSGGVGYLRCLAPILLLALMWSALLLGVSGWLAPMAIERTSKTMAEAARYALVAGLQPGQFDSMDQGRLTIYVGRVDREDGSLTDVFVQRNDPDLPEVLTAAGGRIWVGLDEDSRYLSLFDGHQVRHGVNPAEEGLREITFAQNDIRLPMPALVAGAEGELVQTLPELWPPVTPVQWREWHWRLAPALAALVLALLAVPLSHRSPRQGRFGSLVVALALYLVYSNAIHASLVVMEQRGVVSGPGLWPVHTVIGLVALILIVRQWRRW